MPRRIELELTSERPDGTWTWRAAGAREPKGELEASLLPGGTKVGDVLRADADFHIDGITILQVLPPKGGRVEPERLEVIGPQREFTPVTSTLVGKGDRRGPRPDRGDRGDRPDRGPRPRRDERSDRTDRPRGPRPEGGPRERGDRPERPRRERPAPPPPKPKAKKLRPARTHRDALVAGLSPEQQPIAEQLLRGGMPGVRQALEDQNTKAKAEGLPEIPVPTVTAIAEDLLPRVRVADWLDRAEAAVADADEIALRDLRAVVSGADDVAREESTREMAAQLREVLERRTAAEQTEWLQDLTSSLEGGRVVRALRLSSRPPQPGETLSDELTTKLTEAAGAAMTADIASDRFATLLDAVAYSPVRRSVVPAGAPAEPSEELLAMVRKHAGRVPTVAKLFGIEPPPDRAAKRGPRTPKPKPQPQKISRPPLPPLPDGARRIPPPPRPTAPTAPPGEVPAAADADSPKPHGDELPADAPVVDAPAAAEAPAAEAPPAEVADSPKPHGDELPADAPVEAPAAADAPAAAEAPAAEAPPAETPASPEPAAAAPVVEDVAPAVEQTVSADPAEAVATPEPSVAPELDTPAAEDASSEQLPVAEAPIPPVQP